MAFIKAGLFPVRGALFLFPAEFIGMSTAWYVSRLTEVYLQSVFVFLWVFSIGVGARIKGKILSPLGWAGDFLKIIWEAVKNAQTS